MIEVAPRLFVGNQLDYEAHIKDRPGWYVLQCAKDPYHRDALGYKGMGAPRDHHEYLMAARDNRLILNMVDVDNHKFFAPAMIDAAVDFIHDVMRDCSAKVLVHCNQGGSRAPSIALLYLHRHDPDFAHAGFSEAEDAFAKLYPPYDPAKGINDYLKLNWDRVDDSAGQTAQDDKVVRA